MPYPLFANDYSGLGQLLAQDQARRRAEGMDSVQMFLAAQQRAKDNALRQREFALRQAAQAFDEMNRNRVFGEGQRQFDIGTGQYNRQLDIQAGRLTGPGSPEAVRAQKEAESAAVNDVANRDFDPNKWAGKINPDVLGSIASQDAQLRQEEVRRLEFAKRIADIGTRLTRIKRNADAIKAHPSYSWAAANLETPETDPAAVERLSRIRMQVEPFITDPKQKVVETDPVTGALQPDPSLVMPWMRRLAGMTNGAPTASAPSRPRFSIPISETNAMTAPVPGMPSASTMTATNPYQPGKRYGNLRYLGGDPFDQRNWTPVAQ